MKELFFNNVLFRLVAPPIFGVVFYILILMFFDSIDMLLDNFFSQELLFVVGLTFLFFELQRLLILLLQRFISYDQDLGKRIWIQYLLALLLTLLVISVALRSYFVYVEGFTTIQTELITFNGVYLLVTIFYHLFFFSLIYLNRKNQKKIRKELVLKENLDLEYESFKNQINPDLLFNGLELVIAALDNNREAADQLIYALAKIYRYTLDNQNNDLVPLEEELATIEPLKDLFRHQFNDHFRITLNKSADSEGHLIPGTFLIILEMISYGQIVSNDLPLEVLIESSEKKLSISHNNVPKLRKDPDGPTRYTNLNKAYKYYASEGIQQTISNGRMSYTLPLFNIEND